MLIHVPLDQIDDNPFQRRQDYGDVEGLAADIKARGLLQIPRGRLIYLHGEVIPEEAALGACYRIETDGFPAGLAVQLAFGHRRLRAYRSLAAVAVAGGLLKMPVYVEHMTDDQMLDFVWSENQHRSDINPVEQAELLAEKLERARAAGGNQATVAAAWNLDRSTIANKLRLLDLPAEVQAALRERRLSERQAQALLPVMELEAKLNGAEVNWGTTNAVWNPLSPSAFVGQVLAAPEAATSDAIRQYTKKAIDHAGKPLGDDFATFDAGEGKHIIQPTCKGCPKRQNQTCLDPACFDARSVRYFDALPERAARETGLPYSSDAADFAYSSYDDALAVLGDWKDEKRDGLVVGTDVSGWGSRPFHNGRFVNPHDARVDWRRAIVLGRRGDARPQDNDAAAFAQPAAYELDFWRKSQNKADKERIGRVKEALRFYLQPLMGNDETALRALTAMLDGYTIRETLERGELPTPEMLFVGLFTFAWKRVDTGNYDGTFGNRQALRRLLHTAGISPDLADPDERDQRLADIGQVALLEWNDTRNHVGDARKRLGRRREALAEFDALPNVHADDHDLNRLAVYLHAAAGREEKLAAMEDVGK